MSRIIVKNLPNKVNNEHIISHFSQAGQITDVKLKHKKNGEFRGYGFIGFESEEVAEKAAAQFQNSFFKQNKITTEICYDLDHKIKSRTEKKRAEEERLALKQNSHFKDTLKRKEDMTKDSLRELLQNPDFIQYLTLHQKGTADLVATLRKKYQDGGKEGEKEEKEEEEVKEEVKEEKEEVKEEEEEGEGEGKKKKKKKKNKNKKLADQQQVSDLEYLQSLMKSSDGEELKKKKKKWESLPTCVIRTKEQLTTSAKKGRTFTKPLVKAFLRPLACRSLRIPRGLSYVAYVGFKTEKDLKQALLKDKSFLDGVRVRVHRYEARPPDGEEGGEAPRWKEAEDALLKKAAPVAESGKLFVRNLWYSVTEEDLTELFKKIGPLSDVTLPVSKLTRRPKGFAHVTFVFPDHAVRALNTLDGTSFKGRLLHILPSLDDDEGKGEGDGEGKKKGFQATRASEAKKGASSSWQSWNTLFLGSGAVIDVLAKNFATSKNKLFTEEGEQSLAVNMALGETQIVDETKRFLEDEGVCLECFSNPGLPGGRSKTVLLAKNLPGQTSARELREIFGRHGELGRVLLPPSGLTALIEYLDPSEAKRGFRSLAYSKFKYLPLYLEWAPVGVFKEGARRRGRTEEKEEERSKEEIPPSQNDEEGFPAPLPTPDQNTTLYVKNLNFKTEEDDIRKLFTRTGPVHSVLLARRNGLSQGYAFVQFVRERDAQKALSQMQETTLDGHALQIKRSDKILASPGALPPAASRRGAGLGLPPGADPPTPKILVRNIPFQATPTEIRQLFKTFGELKFVRLPSKPGSAEHRGFGFVEFITKEDAKKALSALSSSTHLYGRRLVLEWANEDESVDELRKRTAEQFLAAETSAKKKRKVELSTPSQRAGFEDS